MSSYIQVVEEEGSEPIEVPCEDQDNSILLSTLTSLFPKASGLKYKNPETGTTRGIRLIEGRLQPPDEGWGTTSLYCCAFIKDNKRKVQSPKTPTSQIERNEVSGQQNKSSNKKRKLTEEEKAIREEERVRKEALKEEERIRKEEEKARKEALREEERIRKEEEKARKEAQKEEERVKREALKEEERLRKEEEKAKREEERARKEAQKEEERIRKEEEKIRKETLKEEEKQKANEKREKQKNILRNFFIKKSFDDSNNRKSAVNIESTANGLFLPFDLGENQTLAQMVPESAKKRFNRQELDRLIETQDSNQLYIDLLKSVDYQPLRSKKSVERSGPEIIIESQSENEENNPKNFRIKHLQFHENVRPPYRGTYRKISSKVKPIKPFNKDTDLFDYEVDSDDEWEEGGPGESLDGSDSDGSVKDDYEIDNEFFVPHGYLSEDENDENEDKTQESPQNDITNGDNDQKELKCRPLLKEQVLMAERNRSFSSSLIPIVLGCIWESNPINKKSIEMLKAYKRVTILTK